MFSSSTLNQFRMALFIGAIALVFAIGPGGDQIAVALLVFAAAASVLIGIAITPLRESNVALAEPRVSRSSKWPIVGAASGLFLVLGFSVNAWWIVAGAGLAFVAIVGALGQAWREDVGWNDVYENRLRERIVWPIGLPVLAFVAVAVVAISVSRVLLIDDEKLAVTIAVVLAAVLLASFSVLAALKKVSTSLLVGLSVVAAVITVAVGVVAAKTGKHEAETVGSKIPVVNVYARETTFIQSPDSSSKLADLSGIHAGQKVTLAFQNFDADIVYHNASIYATDATGKLLPVFAGTPIPGGKKVADTFTAPPAGKYVLYCDFHPSMKASVVVEEHTGAGAE